MNDELAVKLSNLEGLMTGMSTRMERIEAALEKVVTLDRSVAEMLVRHESQQREIKDLGHDIRNCGQTSRSANELTAVRLSGLEKEFYEFKNTTSGVLLALKIFSGVCFSLLMVAASWVYNRVEDATSTNVEQAHQILRLQEKR